MTGHTRCRPQSAGARHHLVSSGPSAAVCLGHEGCVRMTGRQVRTASLAGLSPGGLVDWRRGPSGGECYGDGRYRTCTNNQNDNGQGFRPMSWLSCPFANDTRGRPVRRRSIASTAGHRRSCCPHAQGIASGNAPRRSRCATGAEGGSRLTQAGTYGQAQRHGGQRQSDQAGGRGGQLRRHGVAAASPLYHKTRSMSSVSAQPVSQHHFRTGH